jgi:SanA protein
MSVALHNWPRRALLIALVPGCWLGFEAQGIDRVAAPFVRARVQELPAAQVGLVLGCAERLPDGRRNAFFVNRMAAAAELYRSGKVAHLLLSGDNSRADYDEPSDMQRSLERLGVPRAHLVLDYAGFRTLDSVVRAKQVFGVEQLIVVSQHFHNVRAVYLARAHGIEAYAFDAPEVGGLGGAWPKLREVASRIFAVLDVFVLGTAPRFTGPPERSVLRLGERGEVDEAGKPP